MDDGKKFTDDLRWMEELIEYFKKSKAFTEDLMKENERLRIRVLRAEEESKHLSSQTGDHDLIDTIFKENQLLRSDLETLKTRFDEIENENKDFAQRYVEIEAQNDNLLKLYVSSYQLHSTLNPEEVITIIQEILLNLIGAEEYFICVKDERTHRPTIVAGEAADGPIRGKRLEEVDTILSGVLQGGKEYFRDNADTCSSPIACTPLKVRDTVVGAISISKLLQQKNEGLTPIDHELLNLLSNHAATALVSSTAYSRTERNPRTEEGFLDLLTINGKEAS